jgi:hypothetical protein
MKYIAIICAWFSAFFEKAFVSLRSHVAFMTIVDKARQKDLYMQLLAICQRQAYLYEGNVWVDLSMENAEILSSQSTAAAPKLFRDRIRLATVKSKVTNGRRVFAVGGDGRGVWTRRWQDIVELHVADAGGRDHMTEAMLSLCRHRRGMQHVAVG